LNGELLPFGMGHVPGASLIMSSTRTEMCGIFAALTHLRLIVEFYHIVLRKKASCSIYCDSRAALALVDDKYYEDFGTTWRCRQHYDFEVAIRTCLLQSSIPSSGSGFATTPAVERRNRTTLNLKYLTKLLTLLPH
jgi:hypothetical protein